MDPLSPNNINPSWSTSPTTSRKYNLPLPSSSSSSSFRDPKVFGAPGLGLVNPPNGDAQSPQTPQRDGASSSSGQGSSQGPYLRVRIGGLERNRKDLLIRFDASTNIGTFRTTLYKNMQRSYVEFQRFAEQVALTSPQTIIPALPLASTSAVTDEEDDRLVRIALQRWFSRVCEDPVLVRDEELRGFIESDFGYSPNPPPVARRPTASAAATNVLTAALSKVVRRGPLDEDDELSSAKGALEKLEGNWGSAATSVGALGKARRAHALASQDMGSKFINLSTVESDPSLAIAERKAGRTLEQLSNMAGSQAASENVVLSDSLGYQALNARSAKEALLQRTQILEDSQTASKSAINKRRNVERMKGSSSINPGKVDDAISEMEEANALETQLSSRLNAISQNLHVALRTHSRQAHEDVALALLENARLTIGFHKHTLRELEALRPDFARIGTNIPAAAPRTAPPTMGPQRPYVSPSRQPPPPQPHFQQPPQTAPPMEGSKSMFLPTPTQQAVPRPNSAEPPQARPHDPLGPGAVPPQMYPQQQPQQQQQPPMMAQSMVLPGQAGQQGYPGQQGYAPAQPPHPQQPMMAQSMVLPGQAGPQGYPGQPGYAPGQPPHAGHGYPGRAQTMGRAGGRKLDERQAAKLLAGGF